MSDTRTVRLTVAYDGTDFRGFAESDGVRTVMGDIRRAVETVVRAEVELTGAGRTDAGVHGWGQVISGQLPATTDLGRLQRSLNGLCGPDISVRAADWEAPAFSARFSATGRSYRYHVWNDPAANPLLARTTWHVPQALDLDAMALGAEALLGEHDFSSFCHQMVRSIVGTLVDVGLGRRDAESVVATLSARDRSAAGQVAPPTGLVLWSVDYRGERWDA